MSWQPYAEKEAERQLIKEFAEKKKGKVLQLQDDNDNGKMDGVIEFGEKKINIEARRKGYPNHSGKSYYFKDGWQNKLLLNDGGIFLNELTITNHKNSGFIYIVDIKGFKPRYCVITPFHVNELLKQPHREMKSTNSGVMQSVKTIPLGWFKEY